MESNEQTLLADDTQPTYDANFCSLQPEVQMQYGDGYPVTQEPGIEESSEVIQEDGMNVVERGGSVTHDDGNSVLENGRELKEPVGLEKSRNISLSDISGHTAGTSATVSANRAGVCIGTIVSINEPANSGLAKPFTDETIKAHKIQTAAPTRMDYGASLAMEDFGGEFEDGFDTEESPFASASVFTDTTTSKPDTIISVPAVETDENYQSAQVDTAEVQNDAVDAGAGKQLDAPERLETIPSEAPAGETSAECEEEKPPTLEREVVSKAVNSEQDKSEEVDDDDDDDDDDAERMSSKLPSRRLRRPSEMRSGRKRASDPEVTPTSNLELNVNSRPRRSVNRKSVFELLHVDYRYVGGPKKVAAHRAFDGEVNHEPPAKKQRSPKKGTKASDEHLDYSTKRAIKAKRLLPVRHYDISDIDDQISDLKKKVVGYKPDDFVDDDVEPEVTKSDTEVKDKKSTADAAKPSPQESMFAEKDDLAARSFLATFAAKSAEALSSKEDGDIISQLGVLTAENHELRSRIKALEQSKILTKKFNIDFLGRKFVRMRSPAVASLDQQKTPRNVSGAAVDRTSATERKAPVETGESVLSRIALLDRREHKLRELSSELDERTTAVKIAEGALHRKERKLIDFEKTLEHRERVLTRHEQSILKRELLLGSPALPVDGETSAEEGEDRQSLAAEIQRRLEQRRLELDRRQAAIESERIRLEARERELDQRGSAEGTLVCVSNNRDGSLDTADHSSSRPSKRPTSTGKQKRKASVSRSIRSKYLTSKKQKVLSLFDDLI